MTMQKKKTTVRDVIVIGFALFSMFFGAGNVVFPPLFGLLAQYISISLYPWYLLAALVLMAVMSRALHRKTAAKRAANGY